MSGATPPRGRLGSRLRSFFNRIPFRVLLLFALLAGAIAGLGFFTFSYAEGASYLSDDPEACVNCHVMRDVYDGWNHGSHKAVATCNDCHTPHTLPDKYVVKGLNGLNHSTRFTLDDFHEPIRITDRNRTIAEHNCLYCHGTLAADISHEASGDPTDCVRCHWDVGHD